MTNDGPGEAGQHGGATAGVEPSSDSDSRPAGEGAVLSIVISQPEDVPNPKGGGVSKCVAAGAEKGVAESKWGLQRCDSDREQCRICQQQTEEALMILGCRCRGELAKAHRSCIGIWFQTRGSNKCEICQQVAANVPSPESQPSTNYWVWRVDSAYGGPTFGRGERERGCFSPLWVAFAILIGGLLLDVLISVSLGVSALPVNIIIGVLIVLGLGTALRLALECCHGWGSTSVLIPDTNVNPMTINPGYHPAV